MNHKLIKILTFIILVLFLNSCIGTKEGPVIYISNASSLPIKNIQCSWTKNEKLSLPYLGAGDTRSQSFYISSNDDFFGHVHITWRNNNGEKIVREFVFKENNLPGIHQNRSYNYVQIYLDQESLEIVSSDAPDLAYKMVKMDKLLKQFKIQSRSQSHNKKFNNASSSLISIQHQHNNRSIPRRGWYHK